MIIVNRLILVLTVLVFSTASVMAGSVNVDSSGLAIKGFDPVAYFSDNKALKGNQKFRHKFGGAVYQFASQKNLDLFSKNPGKYTPQYGGYCAYGVAQGYKVKIEPEQFSVVKGKLYLNYNAGVQRSWKKDVSGYVSKANSNWTKISNN